MAKRDPLAGYGRIKVAHLIKWLQMLPPELELPIKRVGGESVVRVLGESVSDAIHIKRRMAETKAFAEFFVARFNETPPAERARLHKLNFPEQYTAAGELKTAKGAV